MKSKLHYFKTSIFQNISPPLKASGDRVAVNSMLKGLVLELGGLGRKGLPGLRLGLITIGVGCGGPCRRVRIRFVELEAVVFETLGI